MVEDLERMIKAEKQHEEYMKKYVPEEYRASALKQVKSEIAALEAKLKAAKLEARENGTKGTDLLAETDLSVDDESKSLTGTPPDTYYSKYSSQYSKMHGASGGGSSDGGSSGSQYVNEYAPSYAKYLKKSSASQGSATQHAGTALLAESDSSTETGSTVEDLERQIKAEKQHEESMKKYMPAQYQAAALKNEKDEIAALEAKLKAAKLAARKNG